MPCVFVLQRLEFHSNASIQYNYHKYVLEAEEWLENSTNRFVLPVPSKKFPRILNPFIVCIGIIMQRWKQRRYHYYSSIGKVGARRARRAKKFYVIFESCCSMLISYYALCRRTIMLLFALIIRYNGAFVFTFSIAIALLCVEGVTYTHTHIVNDTSVKLIQQLCIYWRNGKCRKFNMMNE